MLLQERFLYTSISGLPPAADYKNREEIRKKSGNIPLVRWKLEGGYMYVPETAVIRSDLLQRVPQKQVPKLANYIQQLKQSVSFIANPFTSFKESMRQFYEAAQAGVEIASIAYQVAHDEEVSNDLSILLPPSVHFWKPVPTELSTLTAGNGDTIFACNIWTPLAKQNCWEFGVKELDFLAGVQAPTNSMNPQQQHTYTCIFSFEV